MKIPFVSFLPMENELKEDLREAFDRVLNNSYYIRGQESTIVITIQDYLDVGMLLGLRL